MKRKTVFSEAASQMRYFLLGSALVLALVAMVPVLAQTFAPPPGGTTGGTSLPPPGGTTGTSLPPPTDSGTQLPPTTGGTTQLQPSAGTQMPSAGTIGQQPTSGQQLPGGEQIGPGGTQGFGQQGQFGQAGQFGKQGQAGQFGQTGQFGKQGQTGQFPGKGKGVEGGFPGKGKGVSGGFPGRGHGVSEGGEEGGMTKEGGMMKRGGFGEEGSTGKEEGMQKFKEMMGGEEGFGKRQGMEGFGGKQQQQPFTMDLRKFDSEFGFNKLAPKKGTKLDIPEIDTTDEEGEQLVALEEAVAKIAKIKSKKRVRNNVIAVAIQLEKFCRSEELECEVLEDLAAVTKSKKTGRATLVKALESALRDVREEFEAGGDVEEDGDLLFEEEEF